MSEIIQQSTSNIIINQQNQTNKIYRKINAYTHKPSLQQILAFVLFLINFIMHCVFIIRPILALNHTVLIFIWAIFLLFLGIIIVLYFVITCIDPVDQLLKYPEKIDEWKTKQKEYNQKIRNNLKRMDSKSKFVLQSQNIYQLKQCKACNQMVKYSSYHCWSCGRCVQGMDHHCKFLNNCIGSKNYYIFFCLLSFVIMYLYTGIGIGVWVFVGANSSQQIDKTTYNKWAIIVYIVYTFVLSVVVQILYFFHCYISINLGITTVQYLYRDTVSNNSNSNQKMPTQQQV